MRKAFSDVIRQLDGVPPVIFTLFVLSVVGMNLLANKSIDTGVSWLALDCGLLLSWLAFLSMDILTHCYGPRLATTVSLLALAINLLMAIVFWGASKVPGVWGESFVEGSEQVINHALDATFGGTWFVIAGSSVAFAVSALVNNFLNWSIGEHLAKGEGFGSFALRSYVSTFIAQFVDNLTFAFLVSRTFFGWTTVQCVTCALTGAVLELFFEVVFSPVGYRISCQLRPEQVAKVSGEGSAA